MKTFLGYVSRNGFSLFVWWRVVVGVLGLIALSLGSLKDAQGPADTPSIQAASASSTSPRTCASFRPLRAGTWKE